MKGERSRLRFNLCWACASHQRKLVSANTVPPRHFFYTSVCTQGLELHPPQCSAFQQWPMEDLPA